MRCGALGQLSQKLPQVSIDQQSGSIVEQNNSLLGMNEQVKDQNNIQETLCMYKILNIQFILTFC